MTDKKFYTTKEVAELFFVQHASVVRHLCVNKSYFGLVPHKLPNGRLAWPAKEVKALLAKGDKEK